VETDLRLYLACMPAQREHPTLRVLSELPSPRAGDARRSVSRLSRSRAFDGAFGRLRLIRPLRVGGQWSGDARPVSLSVGRVSRSFDCQLEVVPVDVHLT
jgi:hypothetical protein